MLFVQGSRDPFGTPDELRPILSQLRAPVALHVIEGGDHSFKAPKRAGVTQPDVHRAIQEHIAGWLRERVVVRTVR